MTTATTRLFRLAAVVLIIVTAAAHAGAQHQMPRSVAASGYVMASGNTHQIHGTIGQAAIGAARSNSHAGFFGFWYDADNTTVAVEALSTIAAPSFELAGIYPQPVRNHFTCLLSLPERGSCRLAVYGMLGQLIHRSPVRSFEAGSHRLQLRLPELPAGTYLLRVFWGEQTRATRLVVMR